VIGPSRSLALISGCFAEARGLPWRKNFDTMLSVPPSTAAVASSPKLLDRVRWHLRVKHYSIRTEQTYVDWIRRYILFHRKRHPNEMSEKEITEFLTHLAAEKRVAASTQNQAFSALLFLYQQVLERKLDFIDNVQRVTRPAKLPVVFTRAEAHAVLARMNGEHQLMGELLYGAGLRLMECVRLRIKDIDFGYNQITVRDGKGLRQRVTLLPERFTASAATASCPCARASSTGSRRWQWPGLFAFRLGPQISQRWSLLAVAVCFSSGKTFHRSALGRDASPSSFGEKSSERRPTSDSGDTNRKGGQLPHLSTFFRNPFTGKRAGYPYRSGTFGAPRRFHHHDLHPCSEPTRPCHPQPAGRSRAEEAAPLSELDENFRPILVRFEA
jgi:site-specific recombinase XerC